MLQRFVVRQPNLQVSAYDIFQHGTLTAGLTANNDYLREVDGVVDADGCEDILELVDESEAGCQCLYSYLWLRSLTRLEAWGEAPPKRRRVVGHDGGGVGGDGTYVISAGSEIPPGWEKLPDILGGVRGRDVLSAAVVGCQSRAGCVCTRVCGGGGRCWAGFRGTVGYRQRGGGSRKGGGALFFADLPV